MSPSPLFLKHCGATLGEINGACVWERERDRTCVCMCVLVRVRVCVRVCVCVCTRGALMIQYQLNVYHSALRSRHKDGQRAELTLWETCSNIGDCCCAAARRAVCAWARQHPSPPPPPPTCVCVCASAVVAPSVPEAVLQSARAGHFRSFWIFSLIKTDFLHFYQVNNLFLHQSYLSPLPVKLAW